MTDQEHARAIAEQAAGLRLRLQYLIKHGDATGIGEYAYLDDDATQAIAAALTLTADTARAQGAVDAGICAAAEAWWAAKMEVQDSKGEHIEEGVAHHFVEKEDALVAAISAKFRARATSGDTPLDNHMIV